MSSAETSLRLLHGRGMNNVSDTYVLPADVPEHDRLAVQHRMWRLLFKGLCPVGLKLNTHLQESKGIVLDVGCGAGHWSLDFAREHPAVQVIGFDLAKSANLENMPWNYQFIQGDITKDMAQFFGRASLVNCRAVLGHLKDVSAALDIFHRCLKPGGLILIAEGDTRAFSRDKESLTPGAETSDDVDNAMHSWVSRFLHEVEQLNWKGVDQCGRDLPRWLRDHGGFTDIHAQDYFSPFGWSGDGDEHGDELSEINRTNLTALAHSYKPSFLERRHAPEAVVDTWCKGVQAEVNNPAVQRYVVFHGAWARRP